jgi:hypothetical protein
MYLRILGALVFTLYTLVGCLEGSSSAGGTDAEKKLTPNEAEAERLALSAETLVNPVAFMYAFDIFTKAQTLDPQNQRAGIYLALLQPIMRTQGMLARVGPYVASLPQELRTDFSHQANRVQPASLHNFLFNGIADLKSEADVQGLVAQVTADVANARQYIKSIKGTNFVAHLTIYKELNNPECAAVSDGNGGYDMQECGQGKLHTAILAQPDFEYVQQILAGLQAYGTVATAYDATGFSLLMHALGGSTASEADVVDYVRGLPSMGLLKSQQHLPDLLAMGSDLVAAVRWLQSMQAQLCPNGIPIDRPGYLIPLGMCQEKVDQEGRTLDALLNLWTMALQGSTVDYMFRKHDGTKITTKVQLHSPLAHPIFDARAILPTQFDHCGRGVNIGDGTLAGFFPNGDAASLILRSKACYK